MISEEQKAEAKKHEIVPGAVINCATTSHRYGIVSPYSEWETGDNQPYLIVGKDNKGYLLFALHKGKWATVRTPAPQQVQPRDACKCGPAMQAAIAEKADELGLWSGSDYSGYDGVLVIDNGSDRGKVRPAFFSTNPSNQLNFLTPAQFLTRLEHTLPTVKELTTEEKLGEAVKHVKTLVEHAVFPYDDGQLVATNARAFLKSIKP